MATGPYIIEDDIPIPDMRHGPRSGEARGAVIRALEVSQSVLIEDVTPKDISSRLAYIARTTGRKFTTRKDAAGGVRVWRLS
jgi:hypothetical protein